MDHTLIACLDVDYRDEGAVAAGLWFSGWESTLVEHQVIRVIGAVSRYETGAFYRRELPCLLEVLRGGPRPQAVVIDGYVWLGSRREGLGAHLHRVYGGIVIGVAKSRFGEASPLELYRGKSRRPLYVTAAGVDPQTAALWIASMHGPYRIPTLLKRVDMIARTAYLDRHHPHSAAP